MLAGMQESPAAGEPTRAQIDATPGPVLLEFDREAGERTRRVALDSGAVFVDPEPALRQVGVAGFADFSHFTDRGSAAMAASVAPALLPSLGCTSR